MKLRSVELQLPRSEALLDFFRDTWRLSLSDRTADTWFLRGSGEQPYLLSISEAHQIGVRSVTFAADESEIARVRTLADQAGAAVLEIAEADEPGSGRGLAVTGPEAQVYRFLDAERLPAGIVSNGAASLALADMPVQLTHTVINTADLPACEAFATTVLGFRITDRTRIMTFVRCNQKHHCVAYAPAAMPSLNHVAFEMQDADAVMRGIGRMRDAGFACVWGPGRHGPGNNIFGYFIAPFGGVIEYTSEVSEVEDHYRVGTPADWQWPAGRIDQWGISEKEQVRINAAEAVMRFLPSQ